MIDSTKISKNTDINENSLTPFILFQLGNSLFGINSQNVVLIQDMLPITEISNQSENLRGVAYYKNEIINIFDLRKLFNMPDRSDEVYKVINIPGKIEEHKKAVEAIKSAVEKKSAAGSIGDKYNSNLNSWLNSYKPLRENELSLYNKVAALQESFQLHCKTISAYISTKQYESAEVEFTGNTLPVSEELIAVLNEYHLYLEKNIKEMLIIINTAKKVKIGLSVDYIDTVEFLNEVQLLPPNMQVSDYINCIGLRKTDKSIILLLNSEAFE